MPRSAIVAYAALGGMVAAYGLLYAAQRVNRWLLDLEPPNGWRWR